MRMNPRNLGILAALVIIAIIFIVVGNQRDGADVEPTTVADTESGPLLPEIDEASIARFEIRELPQSPDPDATEEPTVPPSPTPAVTEEAAAQPTAIPEGPAQTIIRRDADNFWQITEATFATDRGVDQVTVTGTISNVLDITYSDRFSINDVEAELDDFGLEEPANEIVLATSDEDTRILIGDQNPNSTRYYVQLGGDEETIYLVPTTVISNVLNYIEQPPYVPAPTPTPTATATPNPFSEVEQTQTAQADFDATATAIATLTAEQAAAGAGPVAPDGATEEVAAEAIVTDEAAEATEEAEAEATDEAADATEEADAEATEEVAEADATEEGEAVAMAAEATEEATEEPLMVEEVVTEEATAEVAETEAATEDAAETEAATEDAAETEVATEDAAETEVATEEVTETEVATEVATEEPLGSIVDVAVASDDLTTLVAAVQAADLVDTLSDEEASFTVFAPTNAAFDVTLDALFYNDVDDFLEDTDLLTPVLTYHVVEGALTAQDIIAAVEEADGELSVETISGNTLTVTLQDDALLINGAVMVIAADVPATNGVVHVIDGVLLPPSNTD